MCMRIFCFPRSLILRLLLLFSFIFSSSGFRYCGNFVEFLFKNFQCCAARNSSPGKYVQRTHILYISHCVQNHWHLRNIWSISPDLEKCSCAKHTHTHIKMEKSKCSLFVQLLIFKPQSGFILSREAVIVPVRNDATPLSKCLIEDVRGFKINVLLDAALEMLLAIHSSLQQCYPLNCSVFLRHFLLAYW